MGEHLKTMTAKEIAEQLGVQTDAVRMKYRRMFPDKPFDVNESLPAEIYVRLLSDGRKKEQAKPAPKKRPQTARQLLAETPPEVQEKVQQYADVLTAAQIVEKFNIPPQVLSEWKEEENTETDFSAWRTAAFSWILVCIVIGHAGLIWFDCSILWGAAGVIGGGMAFLISLAAVLLSFDSARPRTSGFALSIAFFIDCAAWFVHFPTFKASATHVGDIQTGFISAFMCLFSFAALYMLRDSKLD